ncbi:hypothetical protein AGDE_13513 [Angomonas deanei]|uniref:Uncharacterized protein n=1 Tax=Angomonas deanei TaxID=59799 RepID=A0A7G2C594_9TRYP|nr:hypothetical protein AGDE_13513 [Angomonas deanei]CAD2213082.1 hypothetical protein, conserved [Angomonas deanei]|eukprot:EPY22220.1 hypothetical protein AGDE_13513 [Angomonas deanei]
MQNHLYTVGDYTPVFADHVKAKTPEAIRSNILHSCLQEKHASQQSCVSLLTKSESETAAFADTVINIAINDNGLVTINDVSLHWHNPEVAVPMVEMARSYLQEYPLRAGPLGFIKGAKPKESPIINHVAPMAATKNIDEHYMTTLWYLQYPWTRQR